MTLVVLVIVLAEKFEHGAWIVAILIPAIVGGMLFIKRQYAASTTQLAVDAGLRRSGADPPGAGDRAGSLAQPGGRSAPSTSPGPSRTT